MKNRALTLLLMSATVWGMSCWTPAAQAQTPPSPEKQEAMQKLEQMSAKLQLTPQQKKQMLPIMLEEAQKMKAIKANTSLGPLEKMMQMKQVGTDMDNKVQPILTPAQFQQFQQIRAQEREQMMQKMRSGQM
jgi:hypothetical protein